MTSSLHNLNISVWIQWSCYANNNFALYTSKNIIKRSWWTFTDLEFKMTGQTRKNVKIFTDSYNVPAEYHTVFWLKEISNIFFFITNYKKNILAIYRCFTHDFIISIVPYVSSTLLCNRIQFCSLPQNLPGYFHFFLNKAFCSLWNKKLHVIWDGTDIFFRFEVLHWVGTILLFNPVHTSWPLSRLDNVKPQWQFLLWAL